MRIRTAHFPQVKTLEDFNLDHLPSLRRDLLAHLATGTFVAKPGSAEQPCERSWIWLIKSGGVGLCRGRWSVQPFH
jgi:hypothetical protein